MTPPNKDSKQMKRLELLHSYINRTPELLSLLYDLDLLPEQLERYSFRWRQMMILAHWHHATRRKIVR